MALLSSYSSSGSLLPAKPARKARKSLEDILSTFKPIKSVSYTPFQIEPYREPEALLPSTFPTNLYLFDYFSLLFTPDIFCTITTITNRYANIQRIKIVDQNIREQSDLLTEELYVVIRILIYIGVYYKP